MSQPGSVTISLGRFGHADRREALEELAEKLGCIGQRGPSVSHLMQWLADTYIQSADETYKLLDAAGHIAAGGDIDEIDILVK